MPQAGREFDVAERLDMKTILRSASREVTIASSAPFVIIGEKINWS